MLTARQLLLMGRARNRTVGIAIAPLGTVVLLPDPDVRRRVLSCVSHVGPRLSFNRFAEWIGVCTSPADSAAASHACRHKLPLTRARRAWTGCAARPCRC